MVRWFASALLLLLWHSLFAQLTIVPNQGQWPAEVSYRAATVGGALFWEPDRITFNMVHPDDWEHHTAHRHDSEMPSDSVRMFPFSVVFEGGNPDAPFSPTVPYAHKHNYFIGNNPEKWAGDVPVYAALTRTQLYRGVDISYREEEGRLKYDIIVAPGGDWRRIAMRYSGATVYKDREALVIAITDGLTLTETIPAAWQEIDGRKVPVSVRYVVENNRVRFEVDRYNPKYTLVIDPKLELSTYTGSIADNFGFTATFDNDEMIYGGGIVFGPGYPVSPLAYKISWSGLVDIGISKFNEDGTQLIYSTYLGGGSAETPNSLIANSNNELYIYGLTSSLDFPTTLTAFQRTFQGGNPVDYPSNGTNFTNGVDMFVAKLDSLGRTLLASTYLGGSANDGVNDGLSPLSPTKLTYNYGDFFRGEIVLDDNSDVYVASCTQSPDFPVTSLAIQPVYAGQQDGLVLHMDADLTSLRWSTFLGGTDADAAYSLKLDPFNNLYVSGGTTSTDFPSTPSSAFPFYMGGDADGFLCFIENGGLTMPAATFIGTVDFDQNYFIEIDEFGEVYVVGNTEGLFPVSPGTYSNPNSGQYLARFLPDLSQMTRSTVFGKGDGQPDISPTALLVDRCNNVYVSGWGGATNFFSQIPDFNITGMPVTADAFQPQTDGSDFYFIVLGTDMDSLLYATYFGGDIAEEHVDGGTSRFDKRGAIYQAACAGCRGNSDFPITPGAWSATNNSANCNMAVLKFDLELASSVALAAITGNATGCVPLEVDFENQGSKGAQYFWDFGDGDTSSAENPSHVYNTADTFIVTFIVKDATKVCRIPDTFYFPVITVASIAADFSFDPSFPAFGEPVRFTDLSDPASSYRWDFGDGNTSIDQNPTHVFEEPGVYNVCLFIESNLSCFDQICKQIVIPLIDVPNAFSPNGDGVNDILYVKGVGIRNLSFKLYNRWGQLVFQTDSIAKGWDGTVGGVPQEMEVYVYELEAILENNDTVSRTGNITLIR